MRGYKTCRRNAHRQLRPFATNPAIGDALLVNFSGEQTGAPSRCTDIWIGEDTHKQVTEAKKKYTDRLKAEKVAQKK